MPYARNGTWQHRKWECWKKRGGKRRGKTRVLHADLNRNSAFLGGVKMKERADKITRQIAKRVVAKHNRERE